MKPFTLTLLLCFCTSQIVLAQLVIGQSDSIKSESLQSYQKIQILLPTDYVNQDKKYPVLYILDGQWFYLNGVAIQQTLRGESVLPEMILVGIDMNNRHDHDSLLFNKWDELSNYVQKELVSYIDETYRTTQERILFGWENNAFMAAEQILNEPSPFDGAILSNGGSIEDKMIESYKGFGKNQNQKYIYISNSDKDIFTVRHSNDFAKKLEEKKLPNVIWKYELFNEETHESLPYLSLYHGLRFYYHNYGSINYASTEDFQKRGGMAYLKNYCIQRGKRFNQSTEIDAATKNTLIWMAWKEDNFVSFDLFMNAFSEVLNTKRYASAYWQNRLAQFYLKYDDFDHAIEFFDRGIQKFPNEKYMARMYAGLGTAHEKKGNRKMARSNIKKAVQVALKNNDPKLVEYQEMLSEI